MGKIRMTGNARAQQHLVNAGSIWELIDLMFAAPAHSSCDCLRFPLISNVSHMSSRGVFVAFSVQTLANWWRRIASYRHCKYYCIDENKKEQKNPIELLVYLKFGFCSFLLSSYLSSRRRTLLWISNSKGRFFRSLLHFLCIRLSLQLIDFDILLFFL